MSTYGNGYNGWYKDIKKPDSLVSDEYLDLIFGSIQTIIANKKQWMNGESRWATKTLFVSNDSGMLRLHHLDRKGGSIVGFLDITIEPAAWVLSAKWKENILEFLEFVFNSTPETEAFQPKYKDALKALQEKSNEPEKSTCPACNGSGHVDPNSVLGGRKVGGGVCPICKGKGEVRHDTEKIHRQTFR